MSEGVALVTGANGAIGEAISRRLAERGWDVVCLCRDEDKARALVESLARSAPRSTLRYELCDVGRKQEVLALSRRWEGPLHVLINNAACAPRKREETPEGIERVWATNVLGYFWMTKAFAPILSQNAPARVINVASYWAGKLDMQDPEFRQRRYDNDSAYQQSKQANRMLSVAIAHRLESRGIMVNACHPADVDSKLSRNLSFNGTDSPNAGASTPVWLATHPMGEQLSGKWFERSGRPSPDEFSLDDDAVEQLFGLCERY